MAHRFKPFALSYLNDWRTYDRQYVSGLATSNERSVRLDHLRAAANYYKIARSFPKIDEPERLGVALDELDQFTGPIDSESVDAAVCTLAETFQAGYGKYAVSAASKLLWIRFQSPVIIYDGLAFYCIKKNARVPLREGYYDPYRAEWLRQFAVVEPAIRSACAELDQAKAFSFAHDMSDDELSTLASNRWFHERVFDKYLWTLGGE